MKRKMKRFFGILLSAFMTFECIMPNVSLTAFAEEAPIEETRAFEQFAEQATVSGNPVSEDVFCRFYDGYGGAALDNGATYELYRTYSVWAQNGAVMDTNEPLLYVDYDNTLHEYVARPITQLKNAKGQPCLHYNDIREDYVSFYFDSYPKDGALWMLAALTKKDGMSLPLSKEVVFHSPCEIKTGTKDRQYIADQHCTNYVDLHNEHVYVYLNSPYSLVDNEIYVNVTGACNNIYDTPLSEVIGNKDYPFKSMEVRDEGFSTVYDITLWPGYEVVNFQLFMQLTNSFGYAPETSNVDCYFEAEEMMCFVTVNDISIDWPDYLEPDRVYPRTNVYYTELMQEDFAFTNQPLWYSLEGDDARHPVEELVAEDGSTLISYFFDKKDGCYDYMGVNLTKLPKDFGNITLYTNIELKQSYSGKTYFSPGYTFRTDEDNHGPKAYVNRGEKWIPIADPDGPTITSLMPGDEIKVELEDATFFTQGAVEVMLFQSDNDELYESYDTCFDVVEETADSFVLRLRQWPKDYASMQLIVLYVPDGMDEDHYEEAYINFQSEPLVKTFAAFADEKDSWKQILNYVQPATLDAKIDVNGFSFDEKPFSIRIGKGTDAKWIDPATLKDTTGNPILRYQKNSDGSYQVQIGCLPAEWAETYLVANGVNDRTGEKVNGSEIRLNCLPGLKDGQTVYAIIDGMNSSWHPVDDYDMNDSEYGYLTMSPEQKRFADRHGAEFLYQTELELNLFEKCFVRFGYYDEERNRFVFEKVSSSITGDDFAELIYQNEYTNDCAYQFVSRFPGTLTATSESNHEYVGSINANDVFLMQDVDTGRYLNVPDEYDIGINYDDVRRIRLIPKDKTATYMVFVDAGLWGYGSDKNKEQYYFTAKDSLGNDVSDSIHYVPANVNKGGMAGSTEHEDDYINSYFMQAKGITLQGEVTLEATEFAYGNCALVVRMEQAEEDRLDGIYIFYNSDREDSIVYLNEEDPAFDDYMFIAELINDNEYAMGLKDEGRGIQRIAAKGASVQEAIANLNRLATDKQLAQMPNALVRADENYDLNLVAEKQKLYSKKAEGHSNRIERLVYRLDSSIWSARLVVDGEIPTKIYANIDMPDSWDDYFENEGISVIGTPKELVVQGEFLYNAYSMPEDGTADLTYRVEDGFYKKVLIRFVADEGIMGTQASIKDEFALAPKFQIEDNEQAEYEFKYLVNGKEQDMILIDDDNLSMPMSLNEEIEQDPYETEILEGLTKSYKTVYGYIPISLPCLTDEYTIRLYKDGELFEEQSFSMADYLKVVIDFPKVIPDWNSYFFADYAVRMLLVGGAAQEYFGYHTERLASEGVLDFREYDIESILDKINAIFSPGLDGPVKKVAPRAAYAEPQPVLPLDDVTLIGYSLVCRDKLGMKFYFKVDDDLTLEEFEERYYFFAYEDYEKELRNGILTISFATGYFSPETQYYFEIATSDENRQLHRFSIEAGPIQYILKAMESDDEKLKTFNTELLKLFYLIISQSRHE